MTRDDKDTLMSFLQDYREDLEYTLSYLDNLEIQETNRQVVERKNQMAELRSLISSCDQLLESLAEE